MTATARIAIAASLCAFAAPALAQEITINSFGGAYEEAHRKCVIDPFTAETGAKVNIVTAYSADAFAQLRAQKDAPQYDVIHFSGGQEIVAASEGLLVPVTEDLVPALADLYDFAKAGVAKGEGPAYQIAAVGLVVASDKVPSEPTKWADLMKPEYAEHLVLTDISNGYGMIGLLMLNQVSGGTLENIQPGLDAVSKLLDAGAVVVSKSPEIQAEFAQNDAWIAPYASDYAFTLKKAGLNVKFIQGEEGTPASFITANLVAGRDNVELASEFIARELSPEAQACFSDALRYTPTNAKTELSDEVAADVVYGADATKGLMRFDPRVIEANRSAWTEAFAKTIAR
ncbi:ABC transporter substrate-binding protein [Aquibium sp. ELW1220]|uniref:ABC transporter substrate-binding protein n=1 Tax=Aquibium sp. ELW1220 TaxID=2976766 RepID=UPI0025AF8FBA|nr:ABC transporter substrate-binding protein [Aquibium sp. ELW1220]MDN2581808.1 ABC transporter substrate-binding protein [Aquibium sp. ELW1220]